MGWKWNIGKPHVLKVLSKLGFAILWLSCALRATEYPRRNILETLKLGSVGALWSYREHHITNASVSASEWVETEEGITVTGIIRETFCALENTAACISLIIEEPTKSWLCHGILRLLWNMFLSSKDPQFVICRETIVPRNKLQHGEEKSAME